MKNILVVDDLRCFRFACTIARTVMEGMRILAKGGHWDELWLDHDLGMVDGTPSTTIPLVAWIEEECFEGRKPDIGLIVIHTSNPAGATSIELALKRFYVTRRVDPMPYLDFAAMEENDD